jgi:Holliday junction resolvase RusA-like endonuclease
MSAIRFFVPGTPAPKGSMKAYARRTKEGRMYSSVVHDNAKTRPWSSAVTYAAREAMRTHAKFMGTALMLSAVFGLDRPKSHYGRRGLLPSAPRWPHCKPDGDKLTRCIADAMEGIVFDNDSRIVRWVAIKIYVDAAQPTGALVEVRSAHDAELSVVASSYRHAANQTKQETE